MSQAPPITLEITAIRQDQMYHGTESAAAVVAALVRAPICDPMEMESAIVPLSRGGKLYDANIARESCTSHADD
jgi:hypothetical protein